MIKESHYDMNKQAENTEVRIFSAITMVKEGWK